MILRDTCWVKHDQPFYVSVSAFIPIISYPFGRSMVDPPGVVLMESSEAVEVFAGLLEIVATSGPSRTWACQTLLNGAPKNARELVESILINAKKNKSMNSAENWPYWPVLSFQHMPMLCMSHDFLKVSFALGFVRASFSTTGNLHTNRWS